MDRGHGSEMGIESKDIGEPELREIENRLETNSGRGAML